MREIVAGNPANKSPMDRMPDLPGYEILEKVGEGAMAAVWTARQLSLDRVVAIKILSPRLVRDDEAIQRFRLEAQAAAKLNHPGIVQIYDAGSSEGLVYLVMEFVAGCTVGELLERKRRLGEKHSLLVAEGVALALAYAWDEARLIHCDVKPANVLVDQDGSIKITDMGLAKVFGTNVPGSGREMLEGTPHYVSPEQARGEPDIDCRADIYSLGAMLYHMTTGRLPFGDSAEIEVVERQISDYLPDPQQINTDLSEGIAWLIEKMMVKDRTIRYQSWPEVLADMEQIQHGDLPAARTLAAGHSTVLRSEIRSIAKPKPLPEPKAEEVVKKEPGTKKPKTVIKQKIILPKDLREQVGVARKPGGELARAVFALFLMAGAVLLAYGALSYLTYRKAHPPVVNEYWDGRTEVKALPPRSYVQSMKKTEGDASYWQTPAPEAGTSQDSSAEKTDGQTIQWKHPAFLRGARLFNEALAKYKGYLADRSNPAVLKTVEQQCRDSIAAFESCRAFAPPEVKIQDLINQGYRLISDCRQSTLMDSARAGSKQPEATSPLAMTAAAAPASPAEPVEGQLTLAPTWNNTQPGGGKILEDLKGLLSGQGQAAVDLKPDSSLVLFGQVYYLMPLKEAVSILAKPISPRKNVNCPGFPKDSLFYYSVEGEFGNGFDKLLLITDSADRIAAIELVNEHPDESLWLDPAVFSEKWHAYNFVQMQTKGSAKWRVGHRVEAGNRIVRIDSELVANDEYGYFGLGDSKERVSLYLPQQLVNLILLRLEKLKEI
jgi:serine/threonine protein kinase